MSGDANTCRRNKNERENFANNKQTTERLSMKTNQISQMGRLCGAVIALALFTGISGFAYAQDTGSAKGGATKLLELSGTQISVQSQSRQLKPMMCTLCKDTVTQTKADLTTQGAGAMALLAGGTPNRQVSTHTCPECGTKWSFSGHGKAKVRTATHTCPSCGA